MRIAIALALTALAVRFWWQPMYGLTIPSSHGLHRAIGLNVALFWVLLGSALVLLVARVLES
jgi:hypothetical protein